jgi:hypothetical protein
MTIYCGIDPGATTGLVAIDMPDGSLYRIVDARLVGFAVVSAGTSTTDSRANVKARLFHRIRAQLDAWNADVVVIEEPWDALPSWTGKKGIRQEGRGTAFAIGAAYGLALAAASDLPWDTVIASYPVTSAAAKARRPERVGWMQRRQPRCPEHDRTAREQALQLRDLKTRPANGLLPTRADLEHEENDNVYMALGVLSFHLDRERGIV